MRIKLLLLVLIIPEMIFAQSDYLRLFNKYDKSDWISFKFFNNKANDKLFEYKTVDHLLESNSNSQVRLDLIYKGKSFRKGKAIIKYDTTGIIDFKSRNGLLSFPKRMLWFVSEIPYNISELVTKKDTSDIDKIYTIQKNATGFTTFVSSNYWSETFSYDSHNNLIKIERKYNPYGEDSTGFRTFCLNSANKWIGEYDSNHLLISESTFWDNGKEYKASYSFDDGVLIESEYDDIFTNKKQIKKYFYNNGFIHEVQMYDPKGKLIGRLKYKWTIKNAA